jgi:hypothetical protein
MTPESRSFGASARLPAVHEALGWLASNGRARRST